MSCPICVKPLECDNVVERAARMVACYKCQFEACRTCIQNWFVHSDTFEAQCLKCAAPFSKDFMFRNCSAAFMHTVYANTIMRRIWRREKNLIALEMPYIDYYRRIDHLSHFIAKENELLVVYTSQKNNAGIARCQKHIETFRNFIATTCDELDALKHVTRSAGRGRFKCLECIHGIVSEISPVCGSCGSASCAKCRAPVVADTVHECNLDDVHSVAHLKLTTRECPVCVTPIYKIDGCDQMFCVQCNTPFLWSTGAVVSSGFFHNPHYFEMLDKTPGLQIFNTNETGAFLDECDNGALIDTYKLEHHPLVCLNLYRLVFNGKSMDKIYSLCELQSMYLRIIQPELLDKIQAYTRPDYHDARVDVLLGKTSNKAFKRRLVADGIVLDSVSAIYDMNQVTIFTFTDIVNRVMDWSISPDDALVLIKEYREHYLIPHFNRLWRLRRWDFALYDKILDFW